MAKRGSRRVKRVVLGVGHPWYSGNGPEGTYADVRLYKECLATSILFRTHDKANIAGISPNGTGNWDRIRLVAEILPDGRKKK